jgi:hypothetical protein
MLCINWWVCRSWQVLLRDCEVGVPPLVNVPRFVSYECSFLHCAHYFHDKICAIEVNWDGGIVDSVNVDMGIDAL